MTFALAFAKLPSLGHGAYGPRVPGIYSQEVREQANIVLVIIDTLRQDHVGAYGNDWIRTPNLDAFAREAVVFTRCYPESLPTLPVRRALYTGLRTFPYHGHRDYKGDFSGAPGWGPIPEEQDTMSELLSAAGYRTALITDCYPQFKPSKNFHRGFDEWIWIRGQEADPYRSGPEVCRDLLALVVKDAGGATPEEFANYHDKPGCTPFEDRSVGRWESIFKKK